MTGQMVLWCVPVPTNLNDGRPIPQHELDWAIGTLTKFAGGSTAFPDGEGRWLDGVGVLWVDGVRLIQVITPDTAEARAFFSQFARDLASRFQQLAVFIVRLPVEMR